MEGRGREGEPRRKRLRPFETKFQFKPPVVTEAVKEAVSKTNITAEERQKHDEALGALRKAEHGSESIDKTMARGIRQDKLYENDPDYRDDHTKLLQKGIRNNQYTQIKKALDECELCMDKNPQAVAFGSKTYLTVTKEQELFKGQCRIVPMPHMTSLTEADDDVWEEIKNFVKTLVLMNDEKDQGVVFFEITTDRHRHTFLEAIPVPLAVYNELPGLFREAIDSSEQEWSQHRKRIDFSDRRPFTKALVPELPYFAVFFDYKGAHGYGHIIEGVDDREVTDAQDLFDRGSGRFPQYFAQEIVGNVLRLAPKRWRNPVKYPIEMLSRRVGAFREMYRGHDWTGTLR